MSNYRPAPHPRDVEITKAEMTTRLGVDRKDIKHCWVPDPHIPNTQIFALKIDGFCYDQFPAMSDEPSIHAIDC